MSNDNRNEEDNWTSVEVTGLWGMNLRNKLGKATLEQ